MTKTAAMKIIKTAKTKTSPPPAPEIIVVELVTIP
jgi:hypothetical protein